MRDKNIVCVTQWLAGKVTSGLAELHVARDLNSSLFFLAAQCYIDKGDLIKNCIYTPY